MHTDAEPSPEFLIFSASAAFRASPREVDMAREVSEADVREAGGGSAAADRASARSLQHDQGYDSKRIELFKRV